MLSVWGSVVKTCIYSDCSGSLFLYNEKSWSRMPTHLLFLYKIYSCAQYLISWRYFHCRAMTWTMTVRKLLDFSDQLNKKSNSIMAPESSILNVKCWWSQWGGPIDRDGSSSVVVQKEFCSHSQLFQSCSNSRYSPVILFSNLHGLLMLWLSLSEEGFL